MKEAVFIGWSGNRLLAIKIKEKLDKEGFSGVIGGDYEHNPEILRLRITIIYCLDAFGAHRVVCEFYRGIDIDRTSLAYAAYGAVFNLYITSCNLLERNTLQC